VRYLALLAFRFSGFLIPAEADAWRPRRSNADQASPGVPGKTVDECGALCSVKAGCKAFEVYDPQGVTVPRSGCYTFTGTLKQPFTNDKRGLIRTCTKG
jgi:hypothetical protein